MRLAFNIFLIIGAVIIVAVLGAWLYFVHTPPGRDFLKTRAESAAQSIVRAQLDSELSIGELENGLPGRIAINDITLTADGEAWFSADRVEIVWQPFALINKKVIVDRFTLTNAALERLPELPPSEEPPEESDEPFSLPSELPWIEIANIDVSDFRLGEGIAGPARVINAEGGFSTAENRIASDLTLRTGENDDRIRALIGTRRQILTVELTAEGEEDGLINYYADAGGPISIALQGEGPLSAWAGTLDADGAQYGGGNLTFTGDLAELDAIDLAGTLRPGPKLPAEALDATGDEVTVDLSVTTNPRGRIISIDLIEGAFGRLSGRLTGLQDDATIDDGDIDIQLFLNQPYAETLGAGPVAGENALVSTLDYNADGDVAAQGRLTTPAGRVDFADLSWAGGAFDGRLDVAITEPPIDNETVNDLIPRGAQAAARIRFADEQLRVDDLSLFTGQVRNEARLRLSGNASYHLGTERIEASGNVFARPAIIAVFTDQIGFDGPVSGDFTATGTPEDLAVRLNSQFAGGQLAGREFAQGRLEADFTGLPQRPVGNLSLAADNRTYVSRVNLDATESGTIVARELFFRNGLVSLTGDARVNPETQAATAALSLETQGSVPITTDRSLSGAAELTLDTALLQDGARRLEIDLQATDLVSNDIALSTLTVGVTGTDRDADITIRANEVALPNEIQVTEFISDANLSRNGEAYVVQLAEFIARTGSGTQGETINLIAPTTITYDQGAVDIAETTISGFDRAMITLSGLYSSERWVLDANGEALRLPGLQAPLTFDINVDTDNATPGEILLSSQVRDQNDELHRLAVNGEWTGEQLNAEATLRHQDSDYPGRLVISLPLILTRGESLGVATGDGALDGRFTYNAGFEPLLAFLPVGENYVTGTLTADVDIGGTIETPQIDGDIRLADARFEEPRSGAVLTDMDGVVEFSYGNAGTEGRFTITADDASGRDNAVNLQGTVLIGETAGEDGSSISGTLAMNRATIVQSSDLSATVSSNLELSGTLQEMLLAGNIDLENVTATIPDVEGQRSYTPVTVVRVDEADEELEPAEPENTGSPLTLNLDIDITAPNEIYIAGRGLDSEWRTDLQVSGTASDPVLVGTIQIVDGTFEFGGRQFELTEGDIAFSRGGGLLPRLDIVASYTAETQARGDVTARIEVSGMADDPSIELTSTPALPQEDVMAIVLFGKVRGQLTAYESLQIARSVAALTGTGPFGGAGLTYSLRRAAGLDTLSFGQDAETGGGTLTVGKYVSDEVYVSATQGLGDAGNEVSVTYEVTDNITLKSTVEQNGAQSVSANYKKDY